MTEQHRQSEPHGRDHRPGPLVAVVVLLLTAGATLLIVLAALLWTVGGTFLAPRSWLSVLDETATYDRMPAALAETIGRWVESRPPDQPRTLAPLNGDDIEAIVLAVAPPDWLRSQAEAIVPVLVDGFATTGQPPAVPLAQLKARLTSGPVLAAVLDRIGTWPACGAAELEQLAAGTVSRCRPPQAITDQLAVAVAGLVAVVANELPDQLELAGALDRPDTVGPDRDANSGLAGLVTRAAALLPSLILAVIVLLAAAGLLAARSWRRLIMIWAFPALGSGVILLAIAFGIDPIGGVAAATIRSSLADVIGPRTGDLLGTISAALVDRSGWLLVRIGGVLLLSGVAGLVISAVLARRSTR